MRTGLQARGALNLGRARTKLTEAIHRICMISPAQSPKLLPWKLFAIAFSNLAHLAIPEYANPKEASAYNIAIKPLSPLPLHLLIPGNTSFLFELPEVW